MLIYHLDMKLVCHLKLFSIKVLVPVKMSNMEEVNKLSKQPVIAKSNQLLFIVEVEKLSSRVSFSEIMSNTVFFDFISTFVSFQIFDLPL